jgi:nucleoside-triphosphatase THEP1
MSAYSRYGIAVGQVYVPADGTKNRLTVVDVEKYAEMDDVVVFDEVQGIEWRIDAFKLARVRYCLSGANAQSAADLAP